MSITQGVAFDVVNLPDHADVQACVQRLGHTLELSPCDLRTHTGYLPARLDGLETGFEYYLEQAWAIPGLSRGLDKSWTHVACTVLHSDFREGVASYIFLRAFVECAQGGFIECDGRVFSLTDAQPYLEENIRLGRQDLQARTLQSR